MSILIKAICQWWGDGVCAKGEMEQWGRVRFKLFVFEYNQVDVGEDGSWFFQVILNFAETWNFPALSLRVTIPATLREICRFAAGSF